MIADILYLLSQKYTIKDPIVDLKFDPDTLFIIIFIKESKIR